MLSLCFLDFSVGTEADFFLFLLISIGIKKTFKLFTMKTFIRMMILFYITFPVFVNTRWTI